MKVNFNPLKTSLPLSLILVLFLSHCNQSGYPLQNGKSIMIPNPDGWMLVNYWAPWCAPCLKEIPELNHLSKSLPSPLVGVVGIYFDPITAAQLDAEIIKHHVEFPNISAESTSFPVPRPNMLPANYLISAKGEVFGPLLGPQTQQSIMDAIKKYQAQ